MLQIMSPPWHESFGSSFKLKAPAFAGVKDKLASQSEETGEKEK